MGTAPHRFVLKALDPDHGSPVIESLFLVTDLDDLRALLNIDAGDDPELERRYTIDAGELAAINERFRIAFDPGGRDVVLTAWQSISGVPYLVHSGYELPLLLEGRKQLAYFSEAYPPHLHFGEEKFDRYVAEALLHKEVVLEPRQPYHRKDGQVVEGLRTVYYTRKGEEWRIPASRLIWDAAAKSVWSDDFERLQSMLFGYEDWQTDWWIADLRKRRRQFGCVPVCCAVSREDLAWIEVAGYRALPASRHSALTICVTYAREDDDTAQRLMEGSDVIAVIQLSVRSRPFLDLVKGQSGPDYVIPAERMKDLNRNIVGEIEIVACRAASGRPDGLPG